MNMSQPMDCSGWGNPKPSSDDDDNDDGWSDVKVLEREQKGPHQPPLATREQNPKFSSMTPRSDVVGAPDDELLRLPLEQKLRVVSRLNFHQDAMNDRGVEASTEFLMKLFCFPMLNLSQEAKYAQICRWFPHETKLEETFKQYYETIFSLTIDVERRQMSADVKEKVNHQLELVLSSIYQAYEARNALLRIHLIGHPTARTDLPRPYFMRVFDIKKAEEAPDRMKLINFVLDSLFKRQMVRSGELIFRPRFNDDGVFLHYYERECTIEEFMYRCVSPSDIYAGPNQWIAQSSNFRDALKFLTHCCDHRFPVLHRNRHIFAYRNGILNAASLTFYPFERIPGHREHVDELNRHVAACNFINLDFDVAWLRVEDPLDIPTPNIDRILAEQKFGPDVQRWVYGSCLRLVFDVGTFDKWQYWIFFKGVPGCGKSTLLKLVAKFYLPSDIGTLMSDGRRDFCLQHLMDRWLILSYDMSSRSTFPKMTWLQMVAQEPISYQVKNKPTVDLDKCTIPGAVAGNSYFFADPQGNVARRLLVVQMSNVVRHKDPLLLDKCERELAAFMCKGLRLYHNLVRRHGTKGIWDRGVLPDFFHNAKMRMQSETNPLQAFLMEEVVVFEEHATCTMRNFKAEFRTFCSRQSMNCPRVTRDLVAPIFHQNGLKSIEVPRGADPQDYHGHTSNYIIGVRIQS